MNPYERSAAPWSRWFIVSVCTLAVMAASAPLIAVSAFRVLSVEATTPIDWVPERFGPRRAYAEFVDEFESGDVVIASWPGCELGTPALDRLEFIEVRRVARTADPADLLRHGLDPVEHPQFAAVVEHRAVHRVDRIDRHVVVHVRAHGLERIAQQARHRHDAGTVVHPVPGTLQIGRAHV